MTPSTAPHPETDLATPPAPFRPSAPNLADTPPTPFKPVLKPVTTAPASDLDQLPPATASPTTLARPLASKKAPRHHPIESFRIDLTQGQPTAPKKAKTAKPTKLAKTKSAILAHCPACPVCPKTEIELIADTTAMGAVIVQDPANGLNGRSYQALVVLIPFNADQLAAVSEFTKWLDEQQSVNFSKLQAKITKKAQLLNLEGIKGVIVKKAELQVYMEQNQLDFATALRRFAEDLGQYERVTAKLSFDDLKTAVLRKLKHTQTPQLELE